MCPRGPSVDRKGGTMCQDICPDRRVNRRRLLATGGKGLVGASLGGALIAPLHRPTRAAQEAAPIEWWVQQEPEMEYREEHVVGLFEQENPDIEINIEPIPGEDMDRVIATALQAGAGPDILPSAGAAHAGPLSQAGLLL